LVVRLGWVSAGADVVERRPGFSGQSGLSTRATKSAGSTAGSYFPCTGARSDAEVAVCFPPDEPHPAASAARIPSPSISLLISQIVAGDLERTLRPAAGGCC